MLSLPPVFASYPSGISCNPPTLILDLKFQPETMAHIIPSSQVPNDGNTSMRPSFPNTDALSSSCIHQLPIACQPLTPSTDPLPKLSQLTKEAMDKLSL
jgi:hypothetical protein